MPHDTSQAATKLSPWWRTTVILILICGFSVLIWLAVRTYSDAPPIPTKVVDESGESIFTGQDIIAGQEVFLKYGLMENGTIWGHGAYLGPDFSAAYLHDLSLETSNETALRRYNLEFNKLSDEQQSEIRSEVQQTLKTNRYHAETGVLIFTSAEATSFRLATTKWSAYFSDPSGNGGLPQKYISDPKELRELTAFFAWTAWASVVNRPGQSYSYTSNFPYDPSVNNTPTSDAILWSALSLVSLLAGIGLILFIFGKFDYLGWKGKEGHVHPQMLPGVTTESQKATIKYFVIAGLLFLAQVGVGGATAHYRADPGTFYGINLANIFPSNIVRTWHLQLAIFWIATAYIAGGLFLASSLGKPFRNQIKGINFLFGALVVVVAGSLFGEFLGINQQLKNVWFWFGHQGWEYLDLGRAWQILLAIGLAIWVILLFKAITETRRDPEKGEITSLFLYAAIAIPLFYLPAMFFNSSTHFSVVDTWRFWIIHLWVEGFFELFVTVMVAIIFYQLGIVTHITATRVVYLDAILYLGGGIIGTGHHWYWTGQSNITMALGAMFSALEVVPLTLLTLDAWDFMKLSRNTCDVCGKMVSIPHKWTFYFIIAVGVWNFIGAGVFGFLINLPIVSYYEVGTILTPNHGHAAMMGVFGMLAIALMIFAFRQVSSNEQWTKREKFVRLSFWGLNGGLALMVITNLFPGGILQLLDVLDKGYWHARSPEFLNEPIIRMIEWFRLPGDLIFIGTGVIPLVLVALLTFKSMRQNS
ncbi:MAG: nitric-oxide reductase large subunit [Bacteroidota bacterium]|jgi:nitric oxide reductase subunit B